MTPSVRHEINNVLAAVMAEAQLLQMDTMTAEQAAGLDRIVSHTRRLRDLFKAAEPSGPAPTAE